MKLSELKDYELGQRTLRYEARDAILYALAVGASSEETDLVYERDLRVLPTYACALGLWAVEAAGELGAYDRKFSLHASQSLTVHQSMPQSGTLETTGRITGVWDKGRRPGVGRLGGRGGGEELGCSGALLPPSAPTRAHGGPC